MSTKAKELLTSIKKLLFDTNTPPAPAPAVTTVKTIDGIEITVDKMEAGGMAMINGTAAPANTYVLEDGSSIVVDATGKITTVIPKAAPAPTPAPAPAPLPSPAPTAMSEIKPILKFAESEVLNLKTLFDKFASGTPEERLVNLETMMKPIFQYCFGYELRQAQEKADRDAAIAAYQNSLNEANATIASQKETMKQMYSLIEEISNIIPSETPEVKKKFSFQTVIGKKKKEEEVEKVEGRVGKFAQAAKKLQEENKKRSQLANPEVR